VNNLKMSMNAITAAYNLGIQRFYYMGSSCIYPTKDYSDLLESDLLQGAPEKTNEGYALAKIIGLKMCEYITTKNYHDGYGSSKFDYKTFNICNLYGYNDTFSAKGHFVPSLISKIMYRKALGLTSPIRLLGDGTPIREMMFADDAAAVIVNLCKSENVDKFTHINVGSGDWMSIKEIADTVALVMSWTHGIEFEELNGNPLNGAQRKVVNTKLMDELVQPYYIPYTNFEEGLELIISNLYKANQRNFNRYSKHRISCDAYDLGIINKDEWDLIQISNPTNLSNATGQNLPYHVSN